MNLHVDNIIKKSSKTMYLLHVLKSWGLDNCSISDVCISLLINHIHYAAAAWRFMASKSDIARLDKVIKCSITMGYLQHKLDTINFEHISNIRCNAYFEEICSDVTHVLHHMLPIQHVKPQKLRSSSNAFAAPPLKSPHDMRNFLLHMIYQVLNLT